MTIHEPARNIPIAHECDVCIIGGSCTGVFAAVRAARLGAKVAIVEHNILFGGMATAAMVNEWHNTFDMSSKNRIIAGLTLEMVERLQKRNAIRETPPPARIQYRFNSAEMAGELDRFVVENGIRPFLCTKFVTTIGEGGKVDAAIIEDKSGRRAIKAKIFIDASGDGDLIRRSGFEAYRRETLQPVTHVALMSGLRNVDQFWNRTKHRAEEFGYPLDVSFPWIHPFPNTTDITNVYTQRMNGVDASDADQLTAAILKARQQHRALCEMGKAELGLDMHMVGWPHALGVRETWHARCLHELTGTELLEGEKFPDAIANGVYPVDIHHPGGTILRFLDGAEHVLDKGGAHRVGRWKPEGAPIPPCYHIPYRSLVPKNSKNVLVAGRVLDADRDGFAGVRVMVNMNQTGEAAGTAAVIALESNCSVEEVDTNHLRAKLRSGGSVVL